MVLPRMLSLSEPWPDPVVICLLAGHGRCLAITHINHWLPGLDIIPQFDAHFVVVTDNSASDGQQTQQPNPLPTQWL